ncbi:mitogen-activated protein kinase kinase kinase 14 [Parambassis ranga]|uniref:Mitogen-activated protein kinase kinase kinase 14 n=1 Tax=Parambassis ranga TaxID=210632 RepID=A0A6P7IVR8_9TELE|nr:mitogen-activated protein kinase kinase kinase 14-like [Parambassis ranga]
MAVRQRIFNSTAPFSGSPQAKLKGSVTCSTAEQETEEEEEEGKDSKISYMSQWAIVNKLLTQGTAEQVGQMPFKTTTIVAQAECETQDSQEFCCGPSNAPSLICFSSSPSSEHNNVACPTTASIQALSNSPAHLVPRKKTRRRQKRKGKKRKVPEQESGSALVPILEESSLGGRRDLSTSCCSSIESSAEQDRGQGYSKVSSCTPLICSLRVHFPSLQSYEQDSSSDSLCSPGDYTLPLAGLRGNVSQGDSCYAGPFFKDVAREAREEEDELLMPDSPNEGIIFYNDNLQVVDSEYREGREYALCEFTNEGSYGEVYRAEDINTGFNFAVKKIALKRFSSEEVGAWSALRSPRVVELFGVVREGPYVYLLMDHKSGSLSQLIVERGRLPEDLSLHYHSQVLTALEYLGKKRVAHLDIKADNVLLSEDGRDTFLCDFGHAERLDNQGQSLSGSKELKGTETHMAPEIVKGEPRGAKADVWSSCCMLLHMLNGCQPWTRYYTCRLYLKIANEPPPLREVPPDCSQLTAKILKAGLQKDPVKRSSASDLREKTERALREVGGFTSPVKGVYTEPLYITNKPPDSLPLSSSSDIEEVITAEIRTKIDSEAEEEDHSNESKRCSPCSLLITEPNHKGVSVPELELIKLEREFYLSSLSQLHPAEIQEQLLSCISSGPYSTWEPWDKKDSGRWSLSPGDDFSSGVFSYNSQPDVPVLSLELLGHTQQPPPCCFEGVDVCIKDFNRKSIRIREARRVKVGHIATGISDQISKRVFTLETPQGQHIAHDEEVQESGLELCCVPAPDFSPAWRWRIKDGLLETR